MQRTWDKAYGAAGDMLFSSQRAFIDLSTLQPELVDVFRLWQIYLDNVNPMLKATHTPTLQTRIMQAASNTKDIEPGLEALMFGIYATAIMSLTDDYCLVTFEMSRKDLLTKYSFACEQALMKADFLKRASRDILTALLLYLHAQWPCDPRSLSSLSSIAMRLAYRLAIHQESVNTKHTIFEGEMRRRLWWALLLFEVRMTYLARDQTTNMLPTWDCQTPANLDDSELREDLTELPARRTTPTEASYVVVRSEIADYARFTHFYLELENPSFKLYAKSPPKDGEMEMDAIERRMQETYNWHNLEQNPLQAMNNWSTQHLLGRFRMSEFLSRAADGKKLPSDAERDVYFGHALKVLEADTKICTSPLTQGFVWTANLNFPFPAYYLAIQDLKRRPDMAMNKHAWEVIVANIGARLKLPDTDALILYSILGRMLLSAWQTREELLNMQATSFTMPPNVARLQNILLADMMLQRSQHGSISTDVGLTAAVVPSPDVTQQAPLPVFSALPQATTAMEQAPWSTMAMDPVSFAMQWPPSDYPFGDQVRW